MQYEFRVWKDAEKMADLVPKPAETRLQDLEKALKTKPDIVIDTNALGEGIINFAEIYFENVDTIVLKNVQGVDDVKRSFRIMKMTVQGYLYLPIDGSKEKNTNTLLLSEWANIQPESDPKKAPYYRGIILSIITKAGDFRIVRANNVYVESYKETYKDGEFGTFELKLAQRPDQTSKVSIKGVDYEKAPKNDKLKKGIEKSANKKSKK